ncbi:MAG: glycoside hydrolase family 16 protein [Wenzhouxiangellaceae bacterium]|nr:glycoside hydrolase family 16 protein [Wenzhouxiangellaceae bacterium]
MQRVAMVAAAWLAAGVAQAGWEVQWMDRFEGNGVNWDNWTAQTTANFNNERQCYTDDDFSAVRNYDVSDGTLKIIARKMAIECPGQNGRLLGWTSGRLNSKDKQEFLFGRVETRLRFSTLADGTWPAFWMLEGRINEQPVAGDGDNVGWPNPGASEIDIWEWIGRDPAKYIINFFNNGGFACGREIRFDYPNGSADVRQWQVYAMEWTADRISFFFNDTEVVAFDMRGCGVYEEPMFALINLAMGGLLGGEIDPNLEQAVLEVDYIAHCQQSEGSDATGCNEFTPGAENFGAAFDFGNDVEGQWVAAEPGFIGNSQGLAFDYIESLDFLFLAWFTYQDLDAPDRAPGVDRVGARDNRWLTALLTIDGNVASGDLIASTGSGFDAPRQTGHVNEVVGTISIDFTACDEATAEYTLTESGLSRTMQLRPLQKEVEPGFECRSVRERAEAAAR